MTSIAYHVPARAFAFRFGREMAIAATAFAVLLGGFVLVLALHGSHGAPTQSLYPTQTRTGP
jgi:uncharacterized membrane protein